MTASVPSCVGNTVAPFVDHALSYEMHLEAQATIIDARLQIQHAGIISMEIHQQLLSCSL
jgi:hypothetical protein